MKLNWFPKEENHKDTIPADILYLSKRWNIKNKSMLIISNSNKYLNEFNKLNITTWNINDIKYNLNNSLTKFDYILCYHSLSELFLDECEKILLSLSKSLKEDGEIYLTILSKDSYFYKNKTTTNNLYVNKNELVQLLQPFSIKNIEYTKRIKPDNKINPHYYVLASPK